MPYDLDTPRIIPTLCVGRPLELPPLTAQAAFDAQRHSPARQCGQTIWAIETGSSELRVFGSGVIARHGPACALRRARGQLRGGRRRRPIPVEIEVMPWSDTRCEIAIRPRDRGVPMTDGSRQQRYFAVAVEAAEGLACALERHVEHEIVAQLREPGSEDVADIA
jgi:hypothetical protein